MDDLYHLAPGEWVIPVADLDTSEARELLDRLNAPKP